MATVTYASPPEWAPLETRKDYCEHSICTHYCPQNCAAVFFPPPPPFDLMEGIDDSSDTPTTLSPLVIAIIGILASAFLLVGYYAVVSRCFKNRRRRSRGDNEDPLRGGGADTGQSRQDAWQSTPPLSEGLDESVIKSITVCRYKKGDGFVEGTDCPVCLGEFSEDEQVRLLPRCCHAFHVHCIDTWLKSHSSCPICRVNVPPVSVQVLLEMGRPATASVEELREGTPDGFEVRRSQWNSSRTLECVLEVVSGSKQQGPREQGNCSSSM